MESVNQHTPVWETRARIIRMATVGMPEEQIAFILGISNRILNLIYSDDIRAAIIQANLYALEALWALVKSAKSVAALLYWVKTRCCTPKPATNPKSTKQNPYDRGAPTPPHTMRVLNHLGEVIG